MFAWLGDVRNGFGVGGVETHTPIEPLSQSRGWPEGFEVYGDHGENHPTTSECLDEWERTYQDDKRGDTCSKWMGDHSHTWVSAKEVLEAKLPTIKRQGVISKAAFLEWDGVSSPETWSGMISGSKIKVHEVDDITNKTTHVMVHWESSVSEELEFFVEAMQALVGEHGEDVRYVFGFDS